MALRLDGAPVRWWVSGGTAAAFHGATRRPGDLDLECVSDDAPVLAAALGIAMADDAGGCVRSLRGHTRVAGVDVDVSAGLSVDGPGGRVEADDATLWAATRPATWMGLAVRVAPPGEAVARAIAAGDDARLTRARAVGVVVDEGYVARRLGWSSAAR